MAKAKKPDRPQKPRADFPLFPHATGRWAKKVRGKLRYFGKVSDDPKGEKALEKWLDQKDDLLAGRTPRAKVDGFTIADLCNAYLTAKRRLADSREITHRTFKELYATCQRVGNTFGWNRLVVDLAADDFDQLRRGIAKQWGPLRLATEIQKVRSLFKYGYDAALIQQPVRFGPTFKKPSRKVMRLERAKKGPRMLEAAELRTVLAACSPTFKAMVFLGVNCGFGNADVADLPLAALDLDGGWVSFHRHKTGVQRRCPLWPETVAAVRAAIAARPRPKDKAYAKLAFLTAYGRPWRVSEAKPDQEGKPALHAYDGVGNEFYSLLKRLGLHRAGLGFYCLRHGFETIGGGAKDQVAVDAIMGHARDDMASLYRERIDDDRLRAVVEHVRSWLFGKGTTE